MISAKEKNKILSITFSLIKACRPIQWTKNFLVFASILFSFQFSKVIFLNSIYGFISFCLVSSAIYLFNDIRDISKDKLHPYKKFRPIAKGEISKSLATFCYLFLSFLGLFIAFHISKLFLFIISLYIIIQIAYCLELKRKPILDIFCIASGFLLRALSGVIATGVNFSPWFILTIALLALFLAVEKRKAELITFKETSILTRDILKIYTLPLLLRYESLLVSGTFISYSLWAAGPSLNGASSPWMLITLPFVLLGIFRYQFISDPQVLETKNSKNKSITSESPEKILIFDNVIRNVVIFWIITVLLVGKFSN